MENRDAESAILRLIQKGPEFVIPESMAGQRAAEAANIQYKTWVTVYILPILSRGLTTAGDTITATIGNDSSDIAVGKGITRADGR